MKTEIQTRIDLFNANNCTSPDSKNYNWFLNFEYFRFNGDGSFTCKKANPVQFAEDGLVWDILNEASFNFTIAGEDGCINNFDMYSPLFSYDTELLYCIPYTTQEAFNNLEEITVYGREVTEEELKEIEEFF